jgi:hypothetical protein
MTREEDLIRSTTHAIASTVREVPPLRLERAADEQRSPARAPRRARGSADRPRRWRSWAVPLTAAAAVVALAISLVIIKDMPNGSPVPNSTSSSVPAGVPRYYVALKQLAGDMNGSNQRNDIVVGDSLTGKILATFAPPAHTAFESVTAAADDRTFVVFAVTSSNGSFQAPVKGSTMTGSWYAVRLAPGTTHPARLTLLPIKPLTAPASPENYGYANEELDQLIDSFGSVLSGSGQELAVPEWTPPHGWLAVKVFSVATGQLLHDWTAKSFVYSSLTWVDGDRELALGGSTVNVHAANPVTNVKVYEWPVADSDSDNLLANSKVVWDPRPGKAQARFEYCFQGAGGGTVLISPDGKTINCGLGQAQSADDVAGFYTYPLTVSPTVAAQGSVDALLTLRGPALYSADILWASPSGDTLVGALIPLENSQAAAGIGLRIGVINDGKFTPLRVPPSLFKSTLVAITF